MNKWIIASLASSLIFGVMQTSTVEASSKEVSKLKKEKATLQKQLNDEKKKTKKSETEYKTLQGQYENLSKSYKSLDSKYKKIQIENESNKKKVKELSVGYRLLTSSKSLVSDGVKVDGKYDGKESLLMFGKTAYVPLQLFANISGLPLKETTSSFEFGTPASGTPLSAVHMSASSFNHVYQNEPITIMGKLNNQSILLEGYWPNEFATFSLNSNYKKLKGQLSLLTEEALSDNPKYLAYAQTDDETNIVFSDNNGKELGRYNLVFGADPIDFEIDVTNVKGLRVTAEGKSTVSTIISPILTK